MPTRTALLLAGNDDDGYDSAVSSADTSSCCGTRGCYSSAPPGTATYYMQAANRGKSATALLTDYESRSVGESARSMKVVPIHTMPLVPSRDPPPVPETNFCVYDYDYDDDNRPSDFERALQSLIYTSTLVAMCGQGGAAGESFTHNRAHAIILNSEPEYFIDNCVVIGNDNQLLGDNLLVIGSNNVLRGNNNRARGGGNKLFGSHCFNHDTGAGGGIGYTSGPFSTHTTTTPRGLRVSVERAKEQLAQEYGRSASTSASSSETISLPNSSESVVVRQRVKKRYRRRRKHKHERK